MSAVQEVKLKAVVVLKQVVCEQLQRQRLADMLDLLRMTEQRQVLDEDEWDEVVSTALLEITQKQMEVTVGTGAIYTGIHFISLSLPCWRSPRNRWR